CSAVAGDCSDDSACGDPAKACVGAISYIEVAGRVDCYSGRTVECGICCRPAVTGVAYRAISGHSGNDPGRGDPSYATVVNVCNEQVARAVNRHVFRCLKLRDGGWAAV